MFELNQKEFFEHLICDYALPDCARISNKNKLLLTYQSQCAFTKSISIITSAVQADLDPFENEPTGPDLLTNIDLSRIRKCNILPSVTSF